MRRLNVALPVAVVGVLLALLLARTVASRGAAPRATTRDTAVSSGRRDADALAQGVASGPDVVHEPKLVRVQVLDATTRVPIEGAVVEADSLVATTDESGFAALPLARDYEVELVVHARGFVPSEYWLEPRDDDPWIPLAPGIPVAGRVLHADGSPALRAELSVDFGGNVRMDLRADATGGFEFGSPPAREVKVRAEEEGFWPVEVMFAADPEHTTVEFVLGAGFTCEGKVLDEERRPVAGARVTVSDGYATSVWVTTDAEGRFTVRGIPPLGGVNAPDHEDLLLEGEALVRGGSYRARAATQDCRWGQSEEFKGDSGAAPHRCEIVVRQAPYVVLTVTDPEGHPVTRAAVGPCYPTEEPGRYQSLPLSLGPFEIRYGIDGWAPGTIPIDVGPGRNDVHLRLERGREITGTVVDRDGTPLRWIRVHFEGAQTWTADDGSFRLRGLSAKTGALDADGEFHGYLPASVPAEPGGNPLRVVLERAPRVAGRIEPPPPSRKFEIVFREPDMTTSREELVGRDGRFDVWAPRSASGIKITAEGSAPWIFVGIDLKPGKTVDLGVLTAYQGATMEGIVVDREGEPIAEARVEAEAEILTLATDGVFETGESGTFAFTGLPDVAMVVRVEHREHVARVLRIDHPGARPLRIVLEPGGVLEIAATPEGPREVEVQPLAGGDVETITTWLEDPVRKRLLPGRYRVGDRVVEIREGETTRVNLGD